MIMQRITLPVRTGVAILPKGTKVRIVKDPNLYGPGTLHMSKVGMTGTVWGYEYSPSAKYLHWYNHQLIIDLDNKSLFSSAKVFEFQIDAITEEPTS